MKNDKTKKKNRLFIIVLALMVSLFFTLLLTSCAGGGSGETVNIAVAGPESRMEGEFKNGINLAVDEIEKKDYLKGQHVKVKFFDDKRDLSTGIEVAQKIAANADDYTAVIGHWNAFINIPAAKIYEGAGLTSITPMVSSPDLTQKDGKYIFRLVPTDRDEARKVAKYAAGKGYDSIAICYTDSDYGRGLAKEFEMACEDNSIVVTDCHSDFINQDDFDRQYEKWEAMGTKAVFIADSLPYAEELLKYIRDKSKKMPILSAGGFSFDDVIGIMGEDSAGISYTALYNPSAQLSSQKTFNKKYRKKYGEEPESFLAQKGYESIYIVADAVKASGKTDSKSIAGQLHKMGRWQGVSDSYNFKANGDPKGIKLYMVEVDGKSYQYN